MILLSMLASVLPIVSIAQDDDLYFTPKKGVETGFESKLESNVERPTYYSGSNRDVDEYNRRGKLRSYYEKTGTDSLGNDIIEFRGGDGRFLEGVDSAAIYPGSGTYYDDDDFTYSRCMGMYDGFYGLYDPYFYSYWGGPYWRGYYGWYDPWYAGWYDPWYYSSWYGWGYPYRYYGWAGWYGGPRYYSYGGYTGTRNHSGRFMGTSSRGNFGGYRGGTSNNLFTGSKNNGFRNSSNRRGQFGGQRRNTFNQRRNYNNDFNNTYQPSNIGNFGGARGGDFSGGGSFGGGRSGGFSGGGGGGHFGGRR